MLARLHAPTPPLSTKAHDTIQQFHNALAGHGGVDKTYTLLQQNGHAWEGMRRDVKRFVKQCPFCQKDRAKVFQHGTAPFTLNTGEPWERVSMDHVGPLTPDNEGNAHVLVLIDNFTRFTTLWPMKDVTAASTAAAIVRHIGWLGIPGAIQSDNGPAFRSGLLKELFRLTQAQHFRATAYSHEENGIVERSIKTTMSHLRALMYESELKHQWSAVLPMVQRIMNASFHESIQCSPASLVFSSWVDLDQYILHDPMVRDKSTDFSEQHRELLELQNFLIGKVQILLKEMDTQHQERQGQTAERVTYSNGSYVLVRYVESGRPPSKLHTPWAGPFRVAKSDDDDHVVIQDLRDGKTRNIHVSALRPFFYDPAKWNALDIRRRDKDENVIDVIVDYEDRTPATAKTKPQKNALWFRVRWLGTSVETLQPWKDVANTTQLFQFLHDKKLDKLIPKANLKADGHYHPPNLDELRIAEDAEIDL